MKKTPKQKNIKKLGLLISLGFLFFFSLSNNASAKEIDSNEVLTLINSSRNESNIKPLVLNYTLSKVAQSKASDMVANHYFSHTSPTGITPWYWFEKNNYFYNYAGENLAINYSDAKEEHEAWMNSLTHRKNILDSNFSEIGIATATGIIEGKRSKITVTVFGTPQNNIFANNNFYSNKKQSYILGAQSSNSDLLNKKEELQSNFPIKVNPKIIYLAKNQSHNIVWTIALIAILIVFRDIVLKTINTKKFHHRHSVINLILFLMIYTIFLNF